MILSTAYIGNIQYYSKLLSGEAVIDLNENYQKQSYRNRAYISTASGVLALSVPVLHKTGIKSGDIRIDNTKKWQHQHWGAIVSAYSNSPYFLYFSEFFECVYQRRWDFLVELNENLQQIILTLLKVSPTIHYCDSYNDNKSGEELDFRDSISPKIRLQRADSAFIAPKYYQVFSQTQPFAPNLSIIDLLFCEGTAAVQVIMGSIVGEY